MWFVNNNLFHRQIVGLAEGLDPTADPATSRPSAGLSSTLYIEVDAPFIGTSGTKDSREKIDGGA
jgi:hypothetical protein